MPEIQTTKCPHCQSDINVQAAVCPVCKRDIKRKRSGCWLLSSIGLVVAAPLFLVALLGCGAILLMYASGDTPGSSAATSSPMAAPLPDTESIRDSPPDGERCTATPSVTVCVADFSYETTFEGAEGTTQAAPGGTRFIIFAFRVENKTDRDLLVSREQITLITEDGRTYAHDLESTVNYWGGFTALNLESAARGSLGVVFVSPDTLAPQTVVYSGLAEGDITIELATAGDEP